MKNKLTGTLLFIFLSLPIGCSKTIKFDVILPPQKQLKLADEHGDPILTGIRVYQLKGAHHFNAAPVKALFSDDENLLKEDFLEVRKAQMFPESKIRMKVKKTKNAKYIGLIALIKKGEDEYEWKKIFVINKKRKYKIRIKLSKRKDPSSIKFDLDLPAQKGLILIDEYGDQVPADVRIYQLISPGRFNDSNVNSLFKDDQEILKEDLLEVIKKQILPESKIKIRMNKTQRAEYLGLIAMQKKVDNEYSWKKIFNINSEHDKFISIELDRSKEILNLSFLPTENMNADNRGGPLPTTIRIYLLKSDERFNNADFKSLWKKDLETLSEDLIERRDLNVYPENRAKISLKKAMDANYLGIVAIFRRPNEDNKWKQMIDLQNTFPGDISVVINRDNIEILP